MKTLSSTKLSRSDFGGQTTEQRHNPLMLKDFLKGNRNSTKSRQCHGSSGEMLTTIRHLVMDSRVNKKIQKESFLVSCKPASSTLSALHKASSAITKLLSFSIFSPSPQSHTTAVATNNKFRFFIRKGVSSKESNKRRISQSFFAKNRLSHGEIGNEDKTKVGVRDIVQSKSFGDEEMEYENYFDSMTPPQEESNADDGASNSRSSSPTRSCSTWSMNDCSSNLQSSNCGSTCSVEACGMKNGTPLLNYCSSKQEGTEKIRDDFQKDTSWTSNAINCLEISGTNTDIQEVERANATCGNMEVYEEKVKFSPVSVLNFQFEDIDEVSTSPLEEFLPSKERTKQKLPLKIRRYENLVVCYPVNLQERFLSSDCELEDDAFEGHPYSRIDGDGLNCELGNVEHIIKDIVMKYLAATENRRWGSFELLVIDAFKEERSFRSELEEDELMRATATRILDWLEKGITEPDDCKETCLNETERSGHWREFKMGEEEMAAETEADILCSLMDDLMIDIMD